MTDAATIAAKAAPGAGGAQARFTSGNIMRHVVVMAGAGAVGLMAIFVVDLLSLLYVSWLDDKTKIAAVGFASTLMFFAMSVNIGLMIALSALASRALGKGDRAEARRICGSGVALTAALALVIGLGMTYFRDACLGALNARGDTAELASRFLAVALPANVFMGFGIAYSAVLRAAGDARRAMFVTLGGGVATAFLDPLLIFGLRLDVMGAAYATVLSRLIFTLIGYYGAVGVHDLVAWPRWGDLRRHAPALLAIALPAVLTNLATPVGNAVLARIMADYGDAAVAAGAVIDRVTPLAFGGLFALSGAVGPVIGQNWGAGLFHRMRRTLSDSFILAFGYVMLMWAALALARGQLVALFHLEGQAADLVGLYCLISGPGWLGIGALFVANASFNNLGAPVRATLFNWGRATLGTIPFAMAGAAFDGPAGALIGVMLAGMLFGAAATVSAHHVLLRIAQAGLRKPAHVSA